MLDKKEEEKEEKQIKYPKKYIREFYNFVVVVVG